MPSDRHSGEKSLVSQIKRFPRLLDEDKKSTKMQRLESLVNAKQRIYMLDGQKGPVGEDEIYYASGRYKLLFQMIGTDKRTKTNT